MNGSPMVMAVVWNRDQFHGADEFQREDFQRNPRPQPVAATDVPACCRDLDNWPRSWMGLKKDLPPAERPLACFRPFIQHLASSGLSPKTIRNRVDNLWVLGAEMIRGLHEDSSLRKLAVARLLRDVVHADNGPLIHRGSEDEQRSFDSICRKLHGFFTPPQAVSPPVAHKSLGRAKMRDMSAVIIGGHVTIYRRQREKLVRSTSGIKRRLWIGPANAQRLKVGGQP